jgi:hypothetical protein|tara:strand:- start:135 stop:506 length:372 start_codon:yes stop_codon:yes gene_type:complete
MAGIDLSKMDPMVRKLKDAVEAIDKAIENGDSNMAGDALSVIKNTSSFLSEDLWSLVQKAEGTHIHGTSQFVNGVPIAQWEETAKVFDVADRDRMVKGLILPARTGGPMRPQRSPGQYVSRPY